MTLQVAGWIWSCHKSMKLINHINANNIKSVNNNNNNTDIQELQFDVMY